MYNVALCEDEKVFSDNHEMVCRKILGRLNISHAVSVFGSGADFLVSFEEQGKRYDLILLDILMDGMNGVELARKIRAADGEAAIVFITSDCGFALDGYDVNALHYLVKPLDPAVLERLIRADYKKRFQNRFFIFETDRGSRKYRATVRDILYLETVERRVKVVLTDRTLYCPGTLSDLLSALERKTDQFVRCHQSFAINIENVRELTKGDAILINGKEVSVSRNYADDVRKAFASQRLWGLIKD